MRIALFLNASTAGKKSLLSMLVKIKSNDTNPHLLRVEDHHSVVVPFREVLLVQQMRIKWLNQPSCRHYLAAWMESAKS